MSDSGQNSGTTVLVVDAGMNEHLSKPVRAELLDEVISRVLA